jgi:predicted nucleotidyltransferase
MYKLKFTELQQDTIRLLFIKAGTALTANAISKALKVSPTAVGKAMPALEKAGLLLVSKDMETKRLSIQMNRDNHAVVWLKRADNLKQLYESGLVQHFYDIFPEATVIVFGSYAAGEDTMRSDIDIAIIGSGEKKVQLGEFEKALQRQITLNYYKSFRDVDRHLLNNILNCITLKGAVEL